MVCVEQIHQRISVAGLINPDKDYTSGRMAYILWWVEGRIDSCGNNSRTRDNLGSIIPICRKDYVSRKFSNRDHIWRLLELKSLMVGKRRLGVDDEIWVHGTILLLPFGLRCIADARKSSLGPSA
jgi:hypothetical protein